MDVLKLHLLLNYYPAIGFVMGTVVLALGYLFRNSGGKRLALKILALMALFTIAVVFTGEFAGRAAEAAFEGSRAEALLSHKIAATAAFAAVLITGIASVVGIVRGKLDASRPRTTYFVVLIFSLLASILLINTILKGRHVKWAFGPTHTENKLWHA